MPYGPLVGSARRLLQLNDRLLVRIADSDDYNIRTKDVEAVVSATQQLKLAIEGIRKKPMK
jgi:hypothetical protein